MRADPLQSTRVTILMSLFDIFSTVFPIVTIWALYEYAVTIHIATLVLAALLVFANFVSGKSKENPVFSSWLTGGLNAKEFYCFKSIEYTTVQCLCCTKEGRKKLIDEK